MLHKLDLLLILLLFSVVETFESITLNLVEQGGFSEKLTITENIIFNIKLAKSPLQMGENDYFIIHPPNCE